MVPFQVITIWGLSIALVPSIASSNTDVSVAPTKYGPRILRAKAGGQNWREPPSTVIYSRKDAASVAVFIECHTIHNEEEADRRRYTTFGWNRGVGGGRRSGFSFRMFRRLRIFRSPRRLGVFLAALPDVRRLDKSARASIPFRGGLSCLAPLWCKNVVWEFSSYTEVHFECFLDQDQSRRSEGPGRVRWE